MNVTSKISVDLTRQNIGARVNSVQGDGNTRSVDISLLADGKPWTPPDGVEAAIAYKQPGGTKGLYNKLADGTQAISISGNVATVILAPQMLTASGTVQASLVFNDANLNRLTTFPFTVSVAPNPAAGAQKVEDYLRLQWLEDKLEEYLAELKESGVFDGEPGRDGVDGKDGKDGAPGEPGHTPVYGVDYGTQEQIGGISQKAAEILRPDVNQLKDDISDLDTSITVLTANDKKHDRRLRMLELAAEGVLYTEETDTDTAYEKTIPSGALPYATLEKIGGATIVDGDVLKSASVEKVLSIGKNALKPYPGYSTSGSNVTSTMVVKRDKKFVVGLAEVKPGEKIKIATIKGNSFGDRRYFWFADNPIVRHDDIVSIGGGYGASLYLGAILTAPENAKFLAVLMTSTGDERQYWSARRDLLNGYVPYYERELRIPEEIRSLQGYGQSNGEKVNTVDYVNKVYHKAGYYGDDGQWVDNAEEIDIAAIIPDDFEILEVEEGGTLTFHHQEADNGLPIPMPSKESYIVKTGGTTV